MYDIKYVQLTDHVRLKIQNMDDGMLDCVSFSYESIDMKDNIWREFKSPSHIDIPIYKIREVICVLNNIVALENF